MSADVLATLRDRSSTSGDGAGRLPRLACSPWGTVAAEHLRATADRYEAGRTSWTDLDPFGAGLLADLMAAAPSSGINWARQVADTFTVARLDRAAIWNYTAFCEWLDTTATLAEVVEALRATADLLDGRS